MGGNPEDADGSYSGISSGLYAYVGNIPKAATEDELRKFFQECKGIVAFKFQLESCTYCPTKIAFIQFSNRHDAGKAYRLNQTFFQGKRIFVANIDSEQNFTPKYSVMVKNLTEYITEEDVYKHFKHIGTIGNVQKPARNYAYISFDRSESAQRALSSKNRSLKGVDIDIYSVKRNICMLLEKPKHLPYPTIKDKCDALGLRYDIQAEMETKLFVTNIPRQVSEDEILEYLGKFGKIIDWEMQKSPISVLTNIGYVTYMKPSNARFVYLYGPHNFQGVALDIYNPHITYGETKSTTAVLLKRTNVYLTNDEIFQAMNECGRVSYIHRVDSQRYCTIVRFQFYISVKQALKMKRIADENVYVTQYSDQSYVTDIEPIPESMPKGSSRIHKEAALRKIIEAEDRAELTRLQTQPNESYSSPNPDCFKNEVQMMNYPDAQTPTQLKDYFKKCGDVINFREIFHDQFIKVGFLSFNTRLEARRACSMNQNFMNGKRLLLHMADESLYIDEDLCVVVTDLTSTVTDEDIYDRFNDIGNVKFVLRETVARATVCMEQKRWLGQILKVNLIGRCKVKTRRIQNVSKGPILGIMTAGGQFGPTGPMMGRNGPMMGPNGPMVGPNGPMMGPNGPMMGPNGPMMGPNGPMMGPNGPMMGPNGPMMCPNGPMMGPNGPMMGPNGPMMGPNRPMMGPNGPMMGPNAPMMGPSRSMMGPNAPMMGSNGPMMGPNGPMMGGPMMGPNGPMIASNGPMMGPNGPMMGPIPPQGPIVTPAMRRLMQTIERQMIGTQAFSSLPMIDQFQLVHGIVNQLLNVPNFVSMSSDDKIRYLISGQNGFSCAHTFTLFTYPQQQQLLSLIYTDYMNTINTPANPSVVTSAIINIPVQQTHAHAEADISNAMKDDETMAPWQKKPATSVASTSFGNGESVKQFDVVSAQDRFEEATRLQASIQDNQIDQEADASSSSSDSDHIPPAPEPPQFNPTRSRSISPPTLPPQLNRVQSPSSFYRRSRSRSVSRSRLSRSRTPASLPRNLSPFSSALLSSPLLRYNRSLSKSPQKSSPLRGKYRHESPTRKKRASRSRSPYSYQTRHVSPKGSSRYRNHSRSRSPERLRCSPSRSFEKRYQKLSPPRKQRSRSPLWDDEKSTQAKSSEQYPIGASTDIFVGNLPLDATESEVSCIFSRFGQIVALKIPAHNVGTKRAYMRFDTFDQAVKAFEMHLRQYRGHLLRVAFTNKRHRERPGYAVNVSVGGYYDEISIYDTFRMCGDITYVWTRVYNGKSYCVLDFKHPDAVRAALETHKLLDGTKCKVTAIL
ncbi:uncharacterized protein LOC129771947 [Toxorhynchites rutilus septentrionalis]|uniref:uncharacterized protein LOC129771947 n=1 Tax=Toxorhynchites rutilus septentrionalis TaxID=329112 RepID=UPI00247B069F|nr:uncharacterized protein LOC129771947 [Toxorhynchites rutilus septentrionalis]XP_055632091.1 uncharacterized protein LOC129771947 [Toxorhynchites rutilus septentrionalis]